nr:MAG TPA_asm: hypothetical protein [Caudoviricetes sp.]
MNNENEKKNRLPKFLRRIFSNLSSEEKKKETMKSNLMKRKDLSKNKSPKDQKIENHKKTIKELCEIFLEDSQDCNLVENFLQKIFEFIKEEEKIERILYSEISSYIFQLSENDRAIFTSNIDNLLFKIHEEDSNLFLQNYCDEDKKDIIKIAIKVYDHTHLVIHQIENTEKIMASTISNARQEIKKEVNEMEKQYISILGIFASIILAFVGGITFSNSVLSNINQSSIYRIVFVCCLLSFTLINIFYILLSFIAAINNIDKRKVLSKKLYCFIVGILLIIMGICFVTWLIDFKMYQRTTVIPKIFNFINQ